MLGLNEMALIHEVAREEARKVVNEYDKKKDEEKKAKKAKKKAKYGYQPVIYVKPIVDVERIKKLMLNSAYGLTCYTDTDSTKVVSRETLKLEPEELEVLHSVARLLKGECGQLGGDCKNCFCHCDKEVLGTNCLVNQLHEIRRKYS